MTDHAHSDDAHSYRIGAVARLTGISVDRLRAWERRYGVVETRRTEALGRIYNRSDVERLTMIKQLVDLGNSISSVANLTDEQLKERLQQDSRSSHRSDPFTTLPVRVAAYGETIAAMLRASLDRMPGLHLAGAYQHFDDFRRQLMSLAPEVLVLEYAGVYPDTVDELDDLLQRSGARHAVMVCGFGRHDVFKALRERGAVILRSPVSLEELELACRYRRDPEASTPPAATALSSDLGEGIPPRRFRDEELVRLASVSRSVECECPEHLITLIGSLTAFEAYSANCKNRNPDDAVLHAYLHRITAHARALVEEALENVAEMEGLID
ncbi:MAG: MerR family transcriptional regulator [Gammaproteobacteria bacterium]|nr:MAG: MerR family transcriptional regulator [Gammaproteobacteria bacterium]